MSNTVFAFEEIVDREVAQRAGKLHVSAAQMPKLLDLMRETGKNLTDRGLHQAMGEAMLPPIRLLARYKAWTQEFLMPQSFALGEDNKIAIDNPLGAAYLSSPGGRVEYVTPGVQRYTRPSFAEIDAGIFIHWSTLEYAKWNVLQRRLEETADAMAQKKDNIVIPVLNAALVASSHNMSCATTWTKASIDYVISQSAAIGFPVTHVAINPSRVTDMAGWTNGSTSALPVFFSPESAREEYFKQLWFSGYGNLRYFVSKDVPSNLVYYGGDPADTGYIQDHGSVKSVTDMVVQDKGDLHVFWEDIAAYVGNVYSIWSTQIL